MGVLTMMMKIVKIYLQVTFSWVVAWSISYKVIPFLVEVFKSIFVGIGGF